MVSTDQQENPSFHKSEGEVPKSQSGGAQGVGVVCVCVGMYGGACLGGGGLKDRDTP